MMWNEFGRLSQQAAAVWGLFTTAEALDAGLSRKQLTRLHDAGVIEHLIPRVWRFESAPRHRQESVLAAVVALGGHHRDVHHQPTVVAAGESAAEVHQVGDFLPSWIDLIAADRRRTHRPGIQLRHRGLDARDVTVVEAIPVLTIEALIADLAMVLPDLSLISRVVADAAPTGWLTDHGRLEELLQPAAEMFGFTDGVQLRAELYELAGFPRIPSGASAAASMVSA